VARGPHFGHPWSIAVIPNQSAAAHIGVKNKNIWILFGVSSLQLYNKATSCNTQFIDISEMVSQLKKSHM